jgi:glycerophosphoryl diester phosphodiesterase
MADSQKIIIAHRGASGYLPEHTLEAIAVAHTMDAHYLEQDLVLSKDGVPLVLHDIYLDTVTDVARRFPDRKRRDSRFYAIDFTLAELKQLRVTERFDHQTGEPVFKERFPKGHASFEIPTLEEELQLIQGLNQTRGKNAGVYPEIKAPAWHRAQGRDISRIVLEVLDRYGYTTKTDKIYLQCFDFAEVKRIRAELGYQGKLIQLLGEYGPDSAAIDRVVFKTRRDLEKVSKVADGIGPSIRLIVTGKRRGKLQITNLVKNAHDLGLAVHPYTFRADALPEYAASLEEMFRIFLIQLGVDGVFTDHPDRGVAFLRNQNEAKR